MAALLLALALLLGVARVLGELLRRWHQPAVLGELLAGVLLGPTVLGRLFPDAHAALFTAGAGTLPFLQSLAMLAAVLFLLVAGLEVDLSSAFRQGRPALAVAAAGLVVPFAAGGALGWLAPDALGRAPGAERAVFALCFGAAMSISALPVIVRVLTDLGLFRSDFGMVVVAAAVLQDVAGWIVFALVLGSLGDGSLTGGPLAITLGATLAFAALTLTALRWLVHRLLPWVQAVTSWPGGVIGLAVTLALLGAAAAEWIGVHAIFGSFLVGVSIGDSPHLRERTRATLTEFVSFVFAPLFFASIGLELDFAASFHLPTVAVVLAVACATKVGGTLLGARLGGLGRRQAWATAGAMNARGAMEVVLGLLALRAGIIGPRLFVALVVTALVTSMAAGAFVLAALGRVRTRTVADHLARHGYVKPLVAAGKEQALAALAAAAARCCELPADVIGRALLERERTGSTALGDEVALPHARLDGLRAPLVCAGVAPDGVEFDAPDGRRARLLLAILTPREDDAAQLELIADAARLLRDPAVRDELVAADGPIAFLAAVRAAGAPATARPASSPASV